ncbi:hypothetical protein SBY92_003188 [Candida maltosa Xu316]
MKKHDILPKKKSESTEDTVRPKWSSKKKTVDNKDKIVLEDSEDEWDSDVDEALINHFYPQLADNDELTIEQKIKIKQQILNSLQEQENEEEENKVAEMKQDSAKFNLQEFINNLDVKPKKNRKMLNNKFSDNFLEEYGLSSYKDLNKTTDDYNDMYKKKQEEKLRTNINYIPSDRLDGFVIGESKLSPVNTKSRDERKSNIRQLTEEEKTQDLERQKLVEQDNFYKSIKKKFDSDSTHKKSSANKLLEINNFNSNDANQLAYLNERLTRNDNSKPTTNLDDDIDTLLGIKGPKSETKPQSNVVSNNFNDFMSELNINDTPTTGSNRAKQDKPIVVKPIDNKKDLDFLDDLLG